MKHDVFISYSSKNIKVAQAVCHILEQHEIRCWMAPRDIPPGAEYGDLIDEAIKNAKVVVILFSEDSATSMWVKGEMNIAFEEQKVIIPFRLDKTPFKGQNRLMLNQKHWIDAFPDYKTKFNDLVKAVAQTIGKNIELGKSINTTNIDRKPKKSTFVTLLFSIVVLTVAMFISFLRNYTHSYSYDNNGLHIDVNGLSQVQEDALTSILNNMQFVEGGTFVMGNTIEMTDYLTEQDSLSRNPHEVELDNFYICKFEITQKEWSAFLSKEGKYIKEGENIPMDMLSWEDAKMYADTLAAITGLSFSLPTEAQWEFAARGGNKNHQYIFSGNDDATEVGWTSFDELTSAHEVGGKRYNELGIYDMTGNVAEWCLDYYQLYTIDKVINPQGPNKGVNRIIRGGDFRIENLYDMKISTRYFDSPFVNRRGAGLRLVIN
jgi:formylglycine-generating enzyme required for sulfatase activity